MKIEPAKEGDGKVLEFIPRERLVIGSAFLEKIAEAARGLGLGSGDPERTEEHKRDVRFARMRRSAFEAKADTVPFSADTVALLGQVVRHFAEATDAAVNEVAQRSGGAPFQNNDIADRLSLGMSAQRLALDLETVHLNYFDPGAAA